MRLSRRTLLTAAAVTPLGARAAMSGRIVCPLAAEPIGLIPGVFGSPVTRLVGSKLYSGLCRIAQDGTVQPDLAESWEVSGDGMTYIFHLRPGLTWHDSGGVDSADVAFSIDRFHRALQPRLGLGRVVSVRATDPHTVVMTLSAPYAPFLRQLGALSAPIVPRHIHDRPGFGLNPHEVAPVGSGPFRVADWLRLVRFEWFVGSQPSVAEIACPVLPDPAARLALVDHPGLLMVGDAVDPLAVPRLRQMPTVAVSGEPGMTMVGLRLNGAVKPLDDRGVRLGLASAIDRGAVLRDIWLGLGRVPSDPVLADHQNAAFPAYDPRVAAAHLTAAGLRPDQTGIRLHLTLLVPPGPSWQALAERIRLFLQQIGVDLAAMPVSAAELSRRVMSGDYQVAICSIDDPTGSTVLSVVKTADSVIADTQAMLSGDSTQLLLAEPAIPVVADRNLHLPDGVFSNFASAKFS